MVIMPSTTREVSIEDLLAAGDFFGREFPFLESAGTRHNANASRAAAY